jgi:hypothetical protein
VQPHHRHRRFRQIVRSNKGDRGRQPRRSRYTLSTTARESANSWLVGKAVLRG